MLYWVLSFGAQAEALEPVLLRTAVVEAAILREGPNIQKGHDNSNRAHNVRADFSASGLS